MGRFRIKVKPALTFVSNRYVKFVYSTNGIFWKTIRCCTHNFGEAYTMDTLFTEYYNAEQYMDKFRTIDDVRRYERGELEKMYIGNENFRTKRRAEAEGMAKVLAKFGRASNEPTIRLELSLEEAKHILHCLKQTNARNVHGNLAGILDTCEKVEQELFNKIYKS